MRFPKFDLLRPALCLGVLICLSGSISAQRAKQTDFKDLAGPADEINRMRLPDPATLGTRSKTAMIPFRGTGKLIQVPIESSENLKVLLISPNVKDLGLSVSLPGESLADAFESGNAETSFGFDGSQYAAKAFSLNPAKAGQLGIVVTGNQNARGLRNERGFIVISSDSPYQIYSYINSLNTVTGEEIGVVASIFDHNTNSERDVPAALAGVIKNAEMTVTGPDGVEVTLLMEANEDGTFRGNFVPVLAGKYTATVTIRGTTAGGEDLIRTSEHIFQAEKGARIGNAVWTQKTDDLRWSISLPVEGMSAGQKVLAYAEIWGIDGAGNEHSIGWIGGMALTEKISRRHSFIPLSLDSRWLAGAADAEMVSYQLRNVRLQDPDSMVVLGEQTNIELPNVYATRAALESFASLKGASRGEITEEMRMGKRPERAAAPEAVGGKLMLVHGYCSGDAWSQTAQFTNYVKFLDLNKNRTHDQFANLIKNFGASLPSFGIVAHSQGGAASLHLYTYYWSGLDYATGSRLIQSVGTPYRGTALAGNLAVLGQVFGAGCGSNNDLSYSGAASWLAGIPTWARAKVYYHTTSFTDVWYRYDYCSLATDLFLSDPEDGVVEQSYAQLSGGNNMGHKTGWCHTTSMRDPGQTTDSARNSTMNSTAAR